MKILGHLVNPKTEEWYHYDDKYNLWTCGCRDNKNTNVSLCLTINDYLIEEGEYNELRRKVAEKRKELGLLEKETLEEGLKRIHEKTN